MLIGLYSPKGGSGTTISALVLSKAFSNYGHVSLIDASNGDLAIALGLDDLCEYSFRDWATSKEPSEVSLMQISKDVGSNMSCVFGKFDEVSDSPFNLNADICQILLNMKDHCVVDLGTCRLPYQQQILDVCDLSIIVMRSCFLSLYRASMESEHKKRHACIIIRESGRSITTNQIANSLSVDRVLEIEARRDYAKVIDAGVILQRTPQGLLKPFCDFAHDVIDVNYEGDVFDDLAQANQIDFWEENKADRRSREPRKQILGQRYSQFVRGQLLEK